MADKLIEPRTLKGFRDYLPSLMIPREQLMSTARKVYRSYGFVPIDTPALEYTEILLGKGSEETDKQLYRFRDHGDRDVALRFDLTVPFARFAAEHIGTLGVPFKRYHIAPVWRGENTQRGRYREFVQCDFDTIGTTSNAADIEVALIIHDLMMALGFENFVIHINNRMILNGLLEELQLTAQTSLLLRALDKLPKVGVDAVVAEMTDRAGVSVDQAQRVIGLAQLAGSNQTILDHLALHFSQNAKAAEGIARLRELLQVVQEAGVPDQRIQIDVSIARGLDYYTGTVYETFLTDLPKIGSVCSGGRYDNLANLYTKLVLPGVGASLGLDRLLAAMEELKLLPTQATTAPILMVQFRSDYLGRYEAMARAIRQAGLGVELYPESRKLGQQLSYADKHGFRIALIAGPDDFANDIWQIKDLRANTNQAVAKAEVISTLKSILNNTVNL